jgi:hypothetical protein
VKINSVGLSAIFKKLKVPNGEKDQIRKYCLKVIERRQGEINEDTLEEIVLAYHYGWADFINRLIAKEPGFADKMKETEAREKGDINQLMQIWKEKKL